MSDQRRRPLCMLAMDAARGRNLTPADKLVLVYLAYKQGRNGESWPGLDTIRHDLGLALQTILDSTKRLCTVGLLRRTPGSAGRGKSHRYTVCLEINSTEQRFIDDGNTPESRAFDAEKSSKERSEKLYSSEENLSRSIHKEKSTAHPGAKKSKPKGTKTPRRRAPQPFIPPTVEEVATYAESRGVPDFDAARFVGYYEGRQWIKANGQHVQDWKGTVRAWIDRDNQRRAERGEPPHDGYSQYGTHPATEEEIAALQRAGVL